MRELRAGRITRAVRDNPAARTGTGRAARQATAVAASAASAAVNIAARSPETPPPRLTASATAGSRAAPTAAPIWRLVLIMPPTRPWSESAMPRLASTVEPSAVPAVPKPISVTTNSTGL